MLEPLTAIALSSPAVLKERVGNEPGIVCIDIRREFVLEDALREARKKFSPKRKVKVKVTLLTKKLIFSLYILLSLGYFCW